MFKANTLPFIVGCLELIPELDLSPSNPGLFKPAKYVQTGYSVFFL